MKLNLSKRKTDDCMHWRLLKDEKPDNKQSCWIRGEREMILGGVHYDAGSGYFIDLFATPEAGECYSAENGILAWMPAEDIPNLPD